jgi:hypothetical protein
VNIDIKKGTLNLLEYDGGFACKYREISTVFNGHRLTPQEYQIIEREFGGFDMAVFQIEIIQRKKRRLLFFKKKIA